MSLRIRQRYLTRCDISRWVLLAQSTMMILCHWVFWRGFKPASHSFRVLTIFLQNTICPQNTCTSHTILQPFFLKGNCFFLPLLPLLGHVELVKIHHWYSIVNHNVCSDKHIYKCSFKNAMSIFPTYFRGFLGKEVYRIEENLFF